MDLYGTPCSKANKSKFQIPRRTAQGTKNNEVTEEPADKINLEEVFKNLKQQFESVFDYTDELKVISGPAMQIELLENVGVPLIHVNTPWRTTYAHQKAAKGELNRLVCLDVLMFMSAKGISNQIDLNAKYFTIVGCQVRILAARTQERVAKVHMLHYGMGPV